MSQERIGGPNQKRHERQGLLLREVTTHMWFRLMGTMDTSYNQFLGDRVELMILNHIIPTVCSQCVVEIKRDPSAEKQRQDENRDRQDERERTRPRVMAE